MILEVLCNLNDFVILHMKIRRLDLQLTTRQGAGLFSVPTLPETQCDSRRVGFLSPISHLNLSLSNMGR